MRVSFGSFQLIISGEQNLISMLSFNRDFISRSQADFNPQLTLLMEKGDPFQHCSLQSGWSLYPHSEYAEAAYTQKGSVLFSVKYGFFDHHVVVTVPKEDAILVRLGFLYGMLLVFYRNCVGLHGVTVQCGGKTVILSAPSGTGKSTLAGLLEKYGEAQIINGDFAMLSLSEEGVIFEPTPFCGTSGVCLNKRVKVDQIVFLEQAKDNLYCSMNGRQALIAFMNNAFVPTWDDKIQREIMANILRIIADIKVFSFSFAPNKEAAFVFLENLLKVNIEIKKEGNVMDINKIPVPTSKEEMDEIRKMIREEISEDALDMIAGGNDDVKGKGEPTPWTCPFCGATVMIRQFQDGPKHMTKCPGNPYK